MTLGERIKKVRRGADLTQQEFGRRIGIKPNSISLIESGNRNASEQVVLSICREFGINEEWLRAGVGEMCVASPSTVLDALAREYNLRQKDYVLIEKLVRMSPRERDGIFRFMQDVVDGARASGADPDAPVFPAGGAVEAMAYSEEDAEAFGERAKALAKEQFISEKKPGKIGRASCRERV